MDRVARQDGQEGQEQGTPAAFLPPILVTPYSTDCRVEGLADWLKSYLMPSFRVKMHDVLSSL